MFMTFYGLGQTSNFSLRELSSRWVPRLAQFLFLSLSIIWLKFASGQDKANPLSWLATRTGKMATSCPLVISRRCPARIKISFDYEIKSFLSRLGPQKRKNSTLPFLMSSFNHEWNHFKESDVWPQWTRVKRRIGAANYSKNQSKTRKFKPYQHDRETLGMLPRCRDREPRMMSRKHWGESLPESVQVIEDNKR